MNIEIKTLSKELTDDYINFFRNIAFSDHKEWSYCYCCSFHYNDKEMQKIHDEKKLNGTLEDGLKNEARQLISENILQGYLAYHENKVIGWCNCNIKTGFQRLYMRNELWDSNDDNNRIKSIVCFIVAPEMRRQGVATMLLDHVCTEAKINNFSCIEAYPSKKTGNSFDHYPGPLELYKKKDFVIHKEFEKDMIVRKYL